MRYLSTLLDIYNKTCYYHPKYGFVKLEYININGSKLVIQLIARYTEAVAG